MPTPTRPTSKPGWTQGNPGVQVQPTGSQKLAGFAPGERPPAQWHNWLFGILSDWIDWLDYKPASEVTATNTGHNFIMGLNVQDQLDQLDAFLSNLGVKQEVPTGPTTTTLPNDTYTLANPASNQEDILPFVNRAAVDKAEWQLITVGPNKAIKFLSGSIPVAGQSVYAVIFTGSSGGGGGGTVTGASNLGTTGDGFGLFDTLVGGVLKFFRVKAGPGISIVQQTNGIQISAPGSAGGYNVYGTEAVPTSITAAGGIPATGDQRQLRFIVSSGGVVNVTANPQIAAGSIIGQEMLLSGTSDTDYVVLQDGNGLSLNGPIQMKLNETIPLFWTGTVWREISRR